MINKLASAIYNNVVGGLAGITNNPTISLDQLEDDVVLERLQIIKEYSLKNLIPKKDLLMSINCIPVDCKSLDKCPCSNSHSTPIAHFEIPQVVNDIAGGGIQYIGTVDKSTQFKIYDGNAWQYHKYLKRGANKPFVYIDTTPNENNFYDGWLYNAPLLEQISAIIIPKDLRQVEQYSCCFNEPAYNYTFISAEIIKRLSEKYLRYYRQFYQVPQPNNQVIK